VETEYAVQNIGLSGIAVGADGNVWFTELDTLGSIIVVGVLWFAVGAAADSITASVGTAFKDAVAHFKDGTPVATETDFTASIAWGAGTQSYGKVFGPTGGPFQLSGIFKLQMALHDAGDNSTYLASSGEATVQ